MARNVATQCNLILQEQVKQQWEQQKATRLIAKQIKSSSSLKDAACQCFFPPQTIAQTPTQKSVDELSNRRKSNKSIAIQCFIPSSRNLILENKPVPVTVRDQEIQTSTEDVCDVSLPPSDLKSRSKFLRLAEKHLLELKDELHLSYEVKDDYGGKQLLLITRLAATGILGAGLEPICLIVSETGETNLHTLFRNVEHFTFLMNDNNLDSDLFIAVLKRISSKSGNIFCSGITVTKLTSDQPTLSSVQKLETPFLRYQSQKCMVYYTPDKPTKQCIKKCKDCTYVTNLLAKSKKRKSQETPTRIYKRQRITSNFGLKNLSPTSKNVRLQRLRQARSILSRKMKKLESKLKAKEIDLGESQATEMEEMMTVINESCQGELDSVLNDTKLSQKKKQLLKRVWEKDSQARIEKDKKIFLGDQSKCETGRKKNRWSAITLRIALAVYSRSPAAYNALKNFHILELPCEKTLKRKSQKLSLRPGINQEYLLMEEKKYRAYQDEKERKGERKPQGQGALIFDEVKVIDKIIWNSKSNEFKGFAMEKDDYNDLNDVFESKDHTPAATQYILQFIWRDLTSDYHLIGPYFTSANSFPQHFVADALFKTLDALNNYSFSTMCLVCDGASENLSLIKHTLGHQGPFPTDVENITLEPCFENPFVSGQKLHWVVCPSHELKSMVQALFSSKPKGPKQFSRGGVEFGWSDIQALKRREEARFKRNETRFVPGLLTSYIIRDSWTRLNVTPSKIMQQEPLLSELFDFGYGPGGKKEAKESAKLTYDYLRACNQIFEQGLLSHKKISLNDTSCLDSIKKGFEYFSDWVKEELENEELVLTSPKQTKFLSWQTWDLLRICVFGMIGLAEDFLSRYPDYFLAPLRVNGSSVESFFSQIKYATGSKLSGLNYQSGLTSILCIGNIHGHNASNKDIRDTHLYLRESDIF